VAKPRESYRVTLHAEGQGPATPIRLRRFLKSALRAFGLRCTAVEAVKPETPRKPARKGGKRGTEQASDFAI
jgi:hypothetical protein